MLTRLDEAETCKHGTRYAAGLTDGSDEPSYGLTGVNRWVRWPLPYGRGSDKKRL